MATVTGFARQGFFIPYRHADAVPGADRRDGYGAIEPWFERSSDKIIEHLSSIIGYAPELKAMGDGQPPAPRWHQDWFPRLDGAAAYAMIRRHAPKRIVEIGSGHSTRFFARAVLDAGLGTRITAIDPQPRADIETLGIKIMHTTVQTAGLGAFSDIEAGDVLSIDSSHIMMPGSDVDLMLNCLLPTLPGGVIVHIHDIFLPDDYPREWEWRAYNEQLAVACLIQGGGYDIEWSSHYLTSRLGKALEGTFIESLELPQGAHESSLWLKKRDI